MRRKDTEEKLWGKEEVWLYFTPRAPEVLCLFLPFSTKPKQPPGRKGFGRPLEEDKPSHVFYFNTIRREWWKLCPQMRNLLPKGHFVNLQRFIQIQAFSCRGWQQGSARQPCMQPSMTYLQNFIPSYFFAGCRGLVKQSSDAKEAREGHAAGKLLLSSKISG